MTYADDVLCTSPVFPWADQSYRLWSVLELLETDAAKFVRGTLVLSEIVPMSQEIWRETRDPVLSGVDLGPCIKKLEGFEKESRKIGARASADSAKHMIKKLSNPHCSLATIEILVESAISAFRDELESWQALILDSKEKDIYENGSCEFDLVARTRFAKGVDDMEGAAKCYAVGQYSASVFHLMRLMELAIRDWASTFTTLTGTKKTGAEYDKPWKDLEGEIQGFVDKLPTGTLAEREAKDSQRAALILFGNVRNAWRNPTMHPAATYSPKQARYVLDSVVPFIDRLAEII